MTPLQRKAEEARLLSARGAPGAARPRLGQDLRFAGMLVRRLWGSREAPAAWALLLLLVAANGGQVLTMVRMNAWNAAYMDALTDRHLGEFMAQLGLGVALMAFSIVMVVANGWLAQALEMLWRRRLVDGYLQRWFADQRFHDIERQGHVDNPDQRIAEDTAQAVRLTISLVTTGLSMLASLGSFSVLLWRQSGPLDFEVSGHKWSVPGYLLWVAIAYVLVSSVLTHLVGRSLTRAEVQQQRFEANFRFSLIRVRENTEPIAFYRGGLFEGLRLREAFAAIRGNWKRVMSTTLRLNLATQGLLQAPSFATMLIAAPRYFAGRLTLGSLLQLSASFGTVISTMSWFVFSYSNIASWRAVLERLEQLETALDERVESQFEVSAGSDCLAAQSLRVDRPDGTPLVDGATLALAPGVRLLLTGASGSGKSTLLRTLAGLWPHGHGRILTPAAGGVMFLPQRNYLPIGSLRATLSYPAEPSRFGDAELVHALSEVRLGALAGRLDDEDDWSKRLSPGEQQRIAAARVLLQRPSFLLVDEATSALDAELERTVYEAWIRHLPDVALLSIAHRPAVAAFHDRIVAIRDGRLVERPHRSSMSTRSPENP